MTAGASTSHALEQVLLALQAFQVVFLWVHDWVPLGRLNLPERNGMVPNTAHLLLHLSTAATLLVLLQREFAS